MSDNINTPDDDAPGMELIRTSVPKGLLEQALAQAAADGWRPSEFHRMIWVLGWEEYARKTTNRLESVKLRNELRKDND